VLALRYKMRGFMAQRRMRWWESANGTGSRSGKLSDAAEEPGLEEDSEGDGGADEAVGVKEAAVAAGAGGCWCCSASSTSLWRNHLEGLMH
jgi:hypothetical protein